MAAGLKWYFAYGSNMDRSRLVDERLKPRGVTMGVRIGGRLNGWRLTFDKRAREPQGAGAGNIVVAPGAHVYGTLNALPEAGFDVLDDYEGLATGQYRRQLVSVTRCDSGETVESITYVALRVAEGLRPTRAYLAHLLAARDLLPAVYWERLRATPTLD